MTSDEAPAGFVRRELPVDGSPVHVYATLAESGAGGSTTVVVVLAAPPRARRPTSAELRSTFGLTPREAEVALLLAARRSNKEIAQKLSIAHKTAWRHTERVLSKLNTSSRRDVGRVLRAALDGGGSGMAPFGSRAWPATVS